jgi:hypothetical protein
MKNRIFLLLICISFPIFLYGQSNETQPEQAEPVKNVAINAGFLMGGGSLIGIDFEGLVVQDRFGLQLGFGIGSIGGGINYHLKEGVNSSFVSLQYWRQGFGNDYYASYIGPMFVFRAKKLLQIGLGIGNIIDKGPQWEVVNTKEKAQKVNMALLYNIGLYF